MTTIVCKKELCLYHAEIIRTIVRTDEGKYYSIDVEHHATMDEARKRHHEIVNDFDNVLYIGLEIGLSPIG